MRRAVFALLLLLMVIGGGYYYFVLRTDPLTAAANKLSPVTAEQQRQKAIISAATALSTLTAPNIAAGVDLQTIQRIASDSVKNKGVTVLIVLGDQQLLTIMIDLDVTLAPDDIQASKARALIAKVTPHIIGQFALAVSVAANLRAGSQRSLNVTLLPAVQRIHVDKLTVNGDYDVAAAAAAILLLLNRYADNVSWAVASNPLLTFTLPIALQDGFTPNAAMKIDLKNAPDLTLAVTGNVIKSPVVKWENVQRLRLRADSRKRLASKISHR